MTDSPTHETGTPRGSAPAREDAPPEEIAVRLVMPDRWLEHVEKVPLATTIAEAKRHGIRTLLLRDSDDPDDFYVEFAERQVRDEGMTLAELGVRSGGALFIRAYDLGHYPAFEG